MQGAKLMKIASRQMWPIRHNWRIIKASNRYWRLRNHAGAFAVHGQFFSQVFLNRPEKETVLSAR